MRDEPGDSAEILDFPGRESTRGASAVRLAMAIVVIRGLGRVLRDGAALAILLLAAVGLVSLFGR
ncbi:MAG TPA: hypothetical protein VMS01_04095 [Stellaceae bacterium]|nr:hypothetical protein [Stellaceae bacterium]